MWPFTRKKKYIPTNLTIDDTDAGRETTARRREIKRLKDEMELKKAQLEMEQAEMKFSLEKDKIHLQQLEIIRELRGVPESDNEFNFDSAIGQLIMNVAQSKLMGQLDNSNKNVINLNNEKLQEPPEQEGGIDLTYQQIEAFIKQLPKAQRPFLKMAKIMSDEQLKAILESRLPPEVSDLSITRAIEILKGKKPKEKV